MLRYHHILILLLFVFACRKSNNENTSSQKCIHSIPSRIPRLYYDQTINPIPEVQYNQSHCGFLPLGKKNYWVYRDSLFDYTTGQFQSTILDTLRFQQTYQSVDTIIWWKPVASLLWKGFHDRVYSTDSSVYILPPGSFGYRNSIAICFPVNSDSAIKAAWWDDVATITMTGKKIPGLVIVPAGVFSNCLLMKKEISYAGQHKQFLYFAPGTGMIRLVSTTPNGIIGYTSQLVSYHIE